MNEKAKLPECPHCGGDLKEIGYGKFKCFRNSACGAVFFNCSPLLRPFRHATAKFAASEALNAELLEALDTLERCSGLPMMVDDPAREKARVAIADAKGESDD